MAKMQASEERQKKKQKRKAEEGQLQAKRQEMDKAKVSSLCPHTLRPRKKQARWPFHCVTRDERGGLSCHVAVFLGCWTICWT